MSEHRVGKRVFRTKKALTEHCRDILYGRVAFDEEFLYNLLLLHHEADRKIDCGVKRFFVGTNEHGTRCFWLERTDGTKTDWSFTKCITAPTERFNALAAFRNAVRDQIEDFRRAAFRGVVRCAITGEVIFDPRDAHVDHCPPFTFIALVQAFMSRESLTFELCKVNPTNDGSGVTRFEDSMLTEMWRDYHRRTAKLRITTAKANLSQKK